MNSSEYIINKINDLVVRFPQARVRYEVDKHAMVHTIEVLPSNLFHENRDYISWEENMFLDFIERFPREGIGFISDDALVGIENVTYMKEGASYFLSFLDQNFRVNRVSISELQTKVYTSDDISFIEYSVSLIKEAIATIPLETGAIKINMDKHQKTILAA